MDITPEAPIRLSGYGGRTTVSEGIEQPIAARALVFKDAAGVITAILSVDSIGVPAHVRERVVGQIRGRTGIYHVRLALGATHSHYAPALDKSIRNIFEMTPEEASVVRSYTNRLVEKLVQAIDEALAKLAPARISYGKGSAGFAKNRRPQGGPVDQDVPVLAVQSVDGKLIAVVYGYACHATTIAPEDNRVSGDWPAYAADALEAAHPGAVALPLIGCGADANPNPRGELAHAKRHGKELADAVEKVLGGQLIDLPANTDAQFEYVTIPFAAVPSRAELEAATTTGPPQIRRRARLLLGDLERNGKLADTYSYSIQVLRFGDALSMVFLAGEVVVDYAIRLHRELTDQNLWVVAYANDIPCYIPSRRILAEGGYEADDSMVWYGQPSRWDPSIEDTIVEKVKSLLPQGAATTTGRVKPPPAKSPAEALAAFRVTAGLKVELAAAEPEVTDPVQICFDEQGRMYAAEMRDYPLGPGPGKPFDGRVRVLNDRDGDGYYETSHVLADNLPFANGIACALGGVFVTATPEIVFLKDNDGDGKADVRQTVYDGFEPGNSQHLANSIQYGTDGWLYVNGGDGAKIHCEAREGIPDLPLSHTSFRFDPRTYRVEATTGYRGGFGIAFDDRGARFAVDNQTHASHVVFEREDLTLNPDLRVDDTMNEITDHGAEVFPISKTLERYNDPQDYGRFSSACGIHVYGGDALGEEYRGSHFVCEPVSNLVHRDVLVPSGASYTARRGENDTEFLASTDHWFRPVNCATGPDGSLYVVDMYREVIEHPQWIPEHIQKMFDLRSGMDRGRVWRITRPGRPAQRFPGASADSKTLAAELAHPNSWHRQTARRLLVERGTAAEVEAAAGVLAAEPTWRGRIEALWTLASLQKLSPELLEKGLSDPESAVRAAAARVAHGRDVSDARLLELAGDADPQVRFQTAILAAVSNAREARSEVLKRIASRDAGDYWTRTALLLATRDPVSGIAAAIGPGSQVDGVEELIDGLCRLAGTRKQPREIAEAIPSILAGAEPLQVRSLSALLEPLRPGDLQSLLAEGKAAPETMERLRRKLEDVAREAQDENTALPRRVESVSLLAHAALPGAPALLESFLAARYPPDLQAAAVRGLAREPGSEPAAVLIRAFPGMGPQVRGEILDRLLRDPARTMALLDAIPNGGILAREIDLPRRQALLDSSVETVRTRAKEVFQDSAVDPNRAAVVEQYRAALATPELSGPGDAANGELYFAKTCGVCHRVGDRGVPVGADLAALRDRPVDSLLIDVLDPSRAVAPEFVNYSCVTKDGQIFTGLLASESPVSIVLRRAEGKTDSILRRDIAELRSTGESVMPEGLEQQLDPRALRDVLAFIRARPGDAASAGGGDRQKLLRGLASALTFHASFDASADADFARGDPHVYTGKELGADGKPGLTTGNVRVAPGLGRYGGALEFRKKDELYVFFRGEKNVAYSKERWSGAVSLWLRLDPDRDLAPGYCDPVHITERGWNDGAIFGDFTKDDNPRQFRLGAFADRAVWDPGMREWDAVPAEARPMVVVARPGFSRERWTHVLVTWEKFNTGAEDGVAKLYLDGRLQGALEHRKQTFTWTPAKTVIQVGMAYIGLIDDLAIFDRALTPDEARALYLLEDGVKGLRG